MPFRIPFHLAFKKESTYEIFFRVFKEQTIDTFICTKQNSFEDLTGSFGLIIDLDFIHHNHLNHEQINALKKKYSYIVTITSPCLDPIETKKAIAEFAPQSILRPDLKNYELMSVLQSAHDLFSSMEENKIMLQILQNAENSIVITDLDGNIRYANRYFEEITGYEKEEFIGKNPRILKSGVHKPEFYNNLWDKITRKKLWEGIFINKNKEGSHFYEEARITHINGMNDKTSGYLKIGKQVERERLLTAELNKEMVAAKEIMVNMLPDPYHSQSISFDYVLKPFNYLGGDFIAFVKINENRYCCALIDVMGHGVSSTLIGLKCISLFQSLAADFPLNYIVQNINEMITSLNHDTDATSKYLSGVFFDIDLSTKECQYLNAGHPEVLFFDHETSPTKALSNNLLIGVHKDYCYRTEIIDLSKVKKIFFYTDGAIESSRFSDMNEGIDELIRLSKKRQEHEGVSLHSLMDELTSGTEINDDCAICELRISC